ncbi:MAG TPA: DUF2283 domain-containing protein [Actinomycetota bacterium]|nr:DUF2283 domain-containing protein [Actinomycetota bacterium]
MRVLYDAAVDALYLPFRRGARVAKSIVLDEKRILDMDDRGNPVGVEILGASHGVRLGDLTEEYGLQDWAPDFPAIEAFNFVREEGAEAEVQQ